MTLRGTERVHFRPEDGLTARIDDMDRAFLFQNALQDPQIIMEI